MQRNMFVSRWGRFQDVDESAHYATANGPSRAANIK
jgi:hypothetical protein